MIRRIQLWVMGVMVAVTAVGCAGNQPRQVVTPSVPGAQLPLFPWATRSPTEPIIPEAARHIQIIITPGRQQGSQVGYIFVEGTRLFRVYYFTDDRANELVTAVNELEKKTHRFSFLVLFDSGQNVLRRLGINQPSFSSDVGFIPDKSSAQPARTPRSFHKPPRPVAIGGTPGTGWPGDGNPPGVPPPPDTEAFIGDALQTSVELHHDQQQDPPRQEPPK